MSADAREDGPIFPSGAAARAAWWIVVLVGGWMFVPWSPSVATTRSYEFLIHFAWANGFAFGRQVLATYGPLGFVALPFYDRSTYALMLACNVALYALSVSVLWRLCVRVGLRTPTLAAWIALVLLIPTTAPPSYWAPALFVPFTLCNAATWDWFLTERPPGAARMWATAIALAAFVLVKGTFIVPAFACVGAMAVDCWATRRRLPWFPFVFVGALVAAWIAARQDLRDLPGYFAWLGEVARGYKLAVALSGANSGRMAVGFACAAVLLAAPVCLAFAARIGRRALGPALVLAVTLFTLFQHGFVRADPEHACGACNQLAALALLALPPFVATRMFPRRTRVAAACGVAACFALACACRFVMPPACSDADESAGRTPGLAALLRGGLGPLDAASAAHRARVRDECGVDPRIIASPVDCTAVDAVLGEAWGVESRCLPTIDAYAAYTPRLAEADARYFSGTDAPETVVLAGSRDIDDNYPAMVGSTALLALRSGYDARAFVAGGLDRGGVLVLRRRATASRPVLEVVATRDASLGESVPIPDDGRGVVWATIEIESTKWENFVTAVYKPSTVHAEVDAGTEVKRFKLVTEMSRVGMVVSPLLSDGRALEWFFSSEEGETALERVRSIRVTSEKRLGLETHSERVRYVFSRLTAR